MTIEEITRKHWGRWVAIRVVERDEAGQPKKGVLLQVTSDRYRLRNLIREEAACIFFAGPKPRAGGLLI